MSPIDRAKAAMDELVACGVPPSAIMAHVRGELDIMERTLDLIRQGATYEAIILALEADGHDMANRRRGAT